MKTMEQKNLNMTPIRLKMVELGTAINANRCLFSGVWHTLDASKNRHAFLRIKHNEYQTNKRK